MGQFKGLIWDPIIQTENNRHKITFFAVVEIHMYMSRTITFVHVCVCVCVCLCVFMGVFMCVYVHIVCILLVYRVFAN